MQRLRAHRFVLLCLNGTDEYYPQGCRLGRSSAIEFCASIIEDVGEDDNPMPSNDLQDRPEESEARALPERRELLKLLLCICLLLIAVYGSWLGTRWYESNHDDPLTPAVQSHDYQAARRLVEMGADVNEGGNAPLLSALAQGNLDFAQFLVDNGAKIDARGPSGLTTLENIAWLREAAYTDWLLERGAEYTIIAATIGNDIEGVKQFLEEDPTLLARMNEEEHPLLHLAVRRPDTEVAEILLDAGADPDAPIGSPFYGGVYSARHLAHLFENEELLELFDEWDERKSRPGSRHADGDPNENAEESP